MSASGGRYTFEPLTGNPTDAYLALLGKQGTTAGTVATEGTATDQGTLPGYTLQAADAGSVMEVSMLAKNGEG